MISPEVAIIIVNWNKCDCVLSLIEQLGNQSYLNYDIIVIDNNSSDNSTERIRNRFASVKLIENKKNLGGTGGFNTGLRYALKHTCAKYIWLLDNDAQICVDTLSVLVNFMESHHDAGIVGSKIVNATNKNKIVKLGANINWRTGEVYAVFHNSDNDERTNATVKVDYVPSCSALVRADCLSKTGLMDERYFLYWDDTDLGLCFNRSGFDVYANGLSVAYHPAFTEKAKGLAEKYYLTRNALLFFSKHAPMGKRWILFWGFLRRNLKTFLLGIFLKNHETYFIYKKACLDYFRGNFGKFAHHYLHVSNQNDLSIDFNAAREKNVLIIPEDSIERAVNFISHMKRAYPSLKCSIVVPKDRCRLLESVDVENIYILNNRSKNLFLEHVKTFSKLFMKNFNASIILADKGFSPFSYVSSKSFKYTNQGVLVKIGAKRGAIWQPLLATIVGEVGALCLLPMFLLKSFSYQYDAEK